MTRPRPFAVLLVAALALSLAFLALPVVAVFVDVPPGDLVASLGDPVARDALALSLVASTLALGLVVAVGTPAAYFLATRSFRGRSVAITLVELPLVMPPAVAGIALLAALGPDGILAGPLEAAGLQLTFARAGVVVALAFVASPFYVRQAIAAFGALDPTLIEASRTLGAAEGETFRRIAVPAALPGLAAGAALAWARAIGEFGATLLFAGNLQGVTQTAPLAIFEQVGSDYSGALALAAVLVAVSAAVLLAVKLLPGGAGPGGARIGGAPRDVGGRVADAPR